MDLRTFRRNGPGLAERESEPAWRRLWGDRRAHRSLDTRGPHTHSAACQELAKTGTNRGDRATRTGRADVPDLDVLDAVER
jgi:hypothetical protein